MTSIAKWFGNKNDINTLYFHFNWLHKKTFWKNKKKKDYNYITSVNWFYNRKKIKVKLCCCNETNNFLLNKTHFSTKNFYKFEKKHIPILKSNLQKCIRRQLTKLSIRTAISLSLINDNNFQIGLEELLRRICIIILEDVYLMEYFCTLFWFQILCTKRFFLCDKIIKYIISSIAYISDFLYFDNVYQNYELKNKIININDIYFSNSISNNHKNFLFSLMFRTSYGGLKGDILMINKFIQIWYYRFLKKNDACKLLFNLPYIEDIKYLPINPSELLLESFDFHCTNICFKINKVYKIDNNILRKILWHNSSSVNKRIKYFYKNYKKNIYSDEWNIIEKIFKKKSQEIKNEIFNL